MALRDAISAPKKSPPNLRRGNARYRCGLCAHYGKGECMKFGVRVRPNELSDSFKEKSG